jgi:peptidase C1A papain
MKFKKSLFSIIVCAFTFFLVSTNIFAVDVQNKLKDVPVTEGLLNEGYIPNKYYVDSFSSLAGSSNNPYYIENVLQYANLSKFSLRDIIPENVVIRDQGKENSCWAFSTIACLESNLALKNRQKGKPTKVYDFSEQYMVSGSFYDNYLNGQINKKGLNVKPYVGGNFERAMGNVTSGNGVIDESSYPYLNSEAPVDINSLSNKKVTADILDTVIFESPKNEEQFMKLKKAVKEHIVQNGGVYVALRMPKIGDYKFNPVKGSVYNDVKAAQNHTVTIIGWDDNYPKENFNFKPDNNGAWLVKNSYVAHLEQNVDEVKNEIYEFLKSYFNLNGIHSANEIDDNYLIEALNAEYKRQFNIEPVKLVQREDGKKYASIDINTGGYLYISYEDKTLSDYIGIVRAIEKIDYDNIYQNCYYVSGYRDYLTTNNKKIYGVLLGEQYEVNSNDEKLMKFSIRVLSEADYEFYANVNDNDVDMSKLLKLELDNFSTKIHLKPGYHTIYLKEPLKLNSKKFAVATKMSNANSFDVAVGNTNDFNVDWFKYTKPSNNSYLGIIDENENIKLEKMDDADFTLKAYTKKMEKLF